MRAFGLNFEYLTRVGRIIERVVACFSAKSVQARPSPTEIAIVSLFYGFIRPLQGPTSVI